MFWSSSNNSNNLLIDIESNSVGAALVTYPPNSLPHVLTLVRKMYHVDDEAPVETFEKAMLLCLREALKDIHGTLPLLKADGYSTSAKEAHVYFTSPWTISRLKEVNIREKQVVTLDKTAIQAIIETEEKDFKNDLKEIFDSEGKVFSSQITGLYVNGYKASLSMAEKVVSADLHFTLTGAKLELIKKIETEILKVFEVDHHFIHQNFLTAFNKILLSAFSNVHSALLINMTDELSDLLFIHQDNSVGTTTLPMGMAAPVHQLKEALNIPVEIASSYISLYEDGVAEDEFAERIEQILNKTELKWRDLWNKVSTEVFKGKEFPYTVFLAGPLRYEQEAKRLLEKVFVGHEIITVGTDNAFAKHIVISKQNSSIDSKLLMLASLTYK